MWTRLQSRTENGVSQAILLTWFMRVALFGRNRHQASTPTVTNANQNIPSSMPGVTQQPVNQRLERINIAMIGDHESLGTRAAGVNQSHFYFSSRTTRFRLLLNPSEGKDTVSFEDGDGGLLPGFELLEWLQSTRVAAKHEFRESD